jgi:hypothetical protein
LRRLCAFLQKAAAERNAEGIADLKGQNLITQPPLRKNEDIAPGFAIASR